MYLLRGRQHAELRSWCGKIRVALAITGQGEEWSQLMCLKNSSSTVPSSYALEGGDAGLAILKKKRLHLGWGECSLLPPPPRESSLPEGSRGTPIVYLDKIALEMMSPSKNSLLSSLILSPCTSPQAGANPHALLSAPSPPPHQWRFPQPN